MGISNRLLGQAIIGRMCVLVWAQGIRCVCIQIIAIQGVEDIKFPVVLKKKQVEFQRLVENNVEFSGVIKKKHVEFPGALVSSIKISKRCITILQSFQGWSFVLSEISSSKVRNLNIPGVFSKKYILNSPCLFFFWNNPFRKRCG